MQKLLSLLLQRNQFSTKIFKKRNELTTFLFCFRGKILLGYTDSELANMGGYDLVHFDDLAYVASAHQECK